MVRVHWLVGVGLLGVLLIAVVMFLGQTEHLKPAKRISLQPSPADTVFFPPHTDRLKIAVGAIISPAQSLTFYEDIFDYIGEKLGRGVDMIQRKTYTEVNFLMKEGRIDAAFVCSRPYVEGHRDFGMELLCVPVCFGKTEYYSYFIVHKDSSIQKLEDLRGKVFAFTDPLSNSGMLIPAYVLAKMRETPESFFRRYIFTYSHDNSIHSVAEKFVDGAAVDSLIWEYENVMEPEWTSQTKIIYKSAPCGIPPVVVSLGIDQELKGKLRSAFLNMHNDPRGREILKRVLIDRFTEMEDSAYDSIRQMEAFIRDFRSEK
ncbi:MAG: substrate-binding domain-containing protein [Planctomycetota bacterium]|jgi:phosphonate transport system substrate-binding protein